MNVIFLRILIIICISTIEIVRVFLDFATTTKHVYIGICLEYVANAHGSWFLMKNAPSRGLSEMIE